eukprot:CAMPEP_0174832598 /NCGR_PEP_ID=MMETSP1114-20130205/3757_1 /TAXON_ID=312471 /ORGANISM="Neobodo designis, Strain CCAP 1951/1" /LENGTH=582 /DNA_ID=CAMNT_0016066459 /DNA_START=99 /DNA_END=1847 /DNA_ORIENTATION=-
MTVWRVHSQVCDQHLIVLPTPDEAKANANVFRHASELFRTGSMVGFFFTWWRRRDTTADDDAADADAGTDGKAPRIEPPVQLPMPLRVLRRWANFAATYRIILFGRRVVVTSAPRLARRVLHTHFKLYSKDGTNDPNTQVPASLHWLMPKCERGLMTRPDMKDRAPHAQSRTAFAQALLHAADDLNEVRATARQAFQSATGGSNTFKLPLAKVRAVCLTVGLRAFVGSEAVPADITRLTDVLFAFHREIRSEATEPWRWYLLRMTPSWRAKRTELINECRAIAVACLRTAAALPKTASEHLPKGTAPLVAFLRAELPDTSKMGATERTSVEAALVEGATCELIVALVKLVGPMTDAVAWVLHYAALPQNQQLTKTIRTEAASPEQAQAIADAGEQPGAVEALREVCRLHPPLPVVTRTALSDDIVTLVDIDVHADKLKLKEQAMLEATGKPGFTQRSACVMMPSSAVIAVNLDVLLKRTDVFGSDAAEFSPRRFLGDRGSAKSVAEGVAQGGAAKAEMASWYLAGGFGIGARGCPAAHWVQPVAAEIVRSLLGSASYAHPTGKERTPGRWYLLGRVVRAEDA